MSARAICLALALSALPFRAQAQGAEGPLEKLLKADPGILCYRRDYDAAHLKRHPGQLTQTVLLAYEKDGTANIMLRQRGRSYYIGAACEFSGQAAYNTSGTLLIKSFKGPAGYACMVSISPQSAEEGGTVVLDAARNGSTLKLHVDSPVKAGTNPDGRSERKIALKLGREDREFHLTRADQAACKAMMD